MHDVTVDGKTHRMANTYRFVGKPLLYLIKNEEDYNELVANPNFEEYVTEDKGVSAPSETTKERKLREEAEANVDKDLTPVPAAQTDGANSINERPVAD